MIHCNSDICIISGNDTAATLLPPYGVGWAETIQTSNRAFSQF